MEVELSKYRAYDAAIRRLIYLAGLWPCVGDASRFYRLRTFVSAFVISTVAVKLLGYCIENIDNVSIFTKSLGVVLSSTNSMVKIACYLAYRSDLAMLHEELGRKFEDELKAANSKHQDLLLGRINAYARFMRIVTYFTAMTLVSYTIPPFVIYFKYSKLVQIYQGRYPFAVEPGGWLYWTICFMESSTVPLVWFFISGVDNALGLHSFRMCGLLRSLAQHLRDLRSDEPPGYRERLAKCVETHRLLYRCRDALQRAYGIVVLWTYVTSAVIMCSILYQVNRDKKHMSVAKLTFFASYIALKLMQSFTYAYYGSLVSEESEKTQDAIYAAAWAGSGDVQLMKDILIIQTQRPIVLKANGFFIVTMSMFEKILNTTLSYFCLLQTIEGE